MRIGNPFNEALRNPFVDTMLAANAFAQLVPLFKGADNSQEFINAAEAQGAPVTSIPRRGLLSFISPNIQATPDQINQEKIALANAGAGRLANDVNMRAALGPQNYETLRAGNPAMFANLPDFAAPLPGEAKKDGPPVYAINQRDGSEIVLKPGEAPPAGYVTSSFYKKPGNTSEIDLFRNDPAGFDALERAKHKYDRAPADTETPLSPTDFTTGPGGSTGVFVRDKSGHVRFEPVTGATPKPTKDLNAPKPADPAVEHKRAVDLAASADKAFKAGAPEPSTFAGYGAAAHSAWQNSRLQTILRAGGDPSLIGFKRMNSKSQGAGWLAPDGDWFPDASPKRS